MPNFILKIIIKGKANRSIHELIALMAWWENCTNQELRYAYQLVEAIQ